MGSLTTVKYDFSLLLNTAMREKLKLLHYQEQYSAEFHPSPGRVLISPN